MSDNGTSPRVPVARVIGWIEYLRTNRGRIHDEAERDIAFIEDVITKRRESRP